MRKGKTIAEAIRDQRLKAKLSVPELAAKIGYSRSAVYAWEAGARIPEDDSCIILAEFFGCDFLDTRLLTTDIDRAAKVLRGWTVSRERLARGLSILGISAEAVLSVNI